MAKVSLSEEAVTYNIANELGAGLYEESEYEEAKVLLLAALEGRRRLLGEEHKDALGTLNNLGKDHQSSKDCARNLAILHSQDSKNKDKKRELCKEYPRILDEVWEAKACLQGSSSN